MERPVIGDANFARQAEEAARLQAPAQAGASEFPPNAAVANAAEAAKPETGALNAGTQRLQPLLASNTTVQLRIQPARGRVLVVLLGILLGAAFSVRGSVQAAWQELSEHLKLGGEPVPASPAIISEHELETLDRTVPQGQAELLLEQAINHYRGATEQIALRVDGWHGKLQRNSDLESLFTTALNSNDLRVRAAAIEVNLASLNIAKSSAGMEKLESQASSGEQSQRIWALWTIGLLGNRGVEPGRAAETLLRYLHDSNESIRYWAVEGLSYLGTDEVIPALLQTFHDDPSPAIRERAACGLAQSGMLTEKQRRTAVPQLLDFASDPSLDPETHKWVFQALEDITGQRLPPDAAAWRNWYSTSDAAWNPVTKDQE